MPQADIGAFIPTSETQELQQKLLRFKFTYCLDMDDNALTYCLEMVENMLFYCLDMNDNIISLWRMICIEDVLSY
ncbi:MAG: hypothetical protein ACI9LX_000067 [Paraglaciecola sp.]